MKNLETVLEELEVLEQVEEQKNFIVNNLDSATEASRRIAYFEEKKQEIDAIIENQVAPFLAKIEKIKEWGEEAKKEFIDKQSYYTTTLEVYLREEVAQQEEAGKKAKKSIKLPYGKISLKKQQPEFKKDEDTLLEFAISQGYAKNKWSTEWAELKKQCVVHEGKLVFKDTGEFVPGVEVVEKDEKFEFKLT
ncbi:MAG: host-nuclease inhibitor Gam family protein [Bacillus sp. (in: firmicutes)]